MRTIAYLDEALFGRAQSETGHRIRWCLLAGLYLLGVAYWISFFDLGRVSLTVSDWTKESAYLSTLRSAMWSGTLPWQWSAPYYHNTQRFLANPEIVLTPDIVLLVGVSNAAFAAAHVALFYSMGFLGSVRLAKRANANLLSFVFFWLLFNFNGYITAHLATGHFQWTGYFLLPIFLDLVYGAAVKSSDGRRGIDIGSALWIGLVIGALILNGSVHFAIWCCAFLVVMLPWRFTLASTVGVAIATGVGVGLGRLLPAVLYFPSPGPFISGYPSIRVFLAAFTVARVPTWSDAAGGKYGSLLWWEYDVYIGIIAALILIVTLSLALVRNNHIRVAPVLAAGIPFLILSLGDVYAMASKVIPFLGSIERASSRLIVMPFVLSLILAMEGLALAFTQWPRASKTCMAIAIPVITWQLAIHSRYWSVAGLERLFRPDFVPALWLIPNADTRYAIIVYCSWAVSLVTLLVVGVVLLRGQTFARGEEGSGGTDSEPPERSPVT